MGSSPGSGLIKIATSIKVTATSINNRTEDALSITRVATAMTVIGTMDASMERELTLLFMVLRYEVNGYMINLLSTRCSAM